MTGREIYRIWAPMGKKWVNWVRPVPFIGINEYSGMYNFSNIDTTLIEFIDEKNKDTAIIVDLPGTDGVKTGIGLAKKGYRPIPVYNGTTPQQGARATVDNRTIGVALEWGASELQKIEISDDALPAFLMDSNRLHRFKMDASIFDDSWDIYQQDMPSAEYLINNGIDRIIIIGESVSKDLKKILFEYQKKKIKILFTKGYEAPKSVKIHRPLINKD